MPKGREFVPAVDHDGIWFQHCKGTGTRAALRLRDTSTGKMLADPFDPICNLRPRTPPEQYRDKAVINHKNSNLFSGHDNRHTLQSDGIYLGNGRGTRILGRRIFSPSSRLHHTEEQFLKHFDRKPVDHDLSTSYRVTYKGETSEQPEYRRYPRRYPDGQADQSELTTSTTAWFRPPHVPHRTALHIMAVSQEPFLEHNPWRYSYNGSSDVYPSYRKKQQMFSTRPIFNNYGSAFQQHA